MKKQYVAMILGMVLGVSALGGCAVTPESSLVKQKGESAMKNYKSADDTSESTSGATGGSGTEGETSGTSESGTTDGSTAENTDGQADTASAALSSEQGSTEGTGNAALRERLGAPETYQSEVTDVTGNLTISTNAKVLLPDAEKLNTITVTQHTFDQTAIDTITAAFFPDATVYDGTEYSKWTKSEIQAKLDELNGYVAAGNLDPYNDGTDENGNYNYDIYSNIEYWQSELAAAPEERELKEVKPQFGLSHTDSDGEVYTDDTQFDGVVKMADGSTYSYFLRNTTDTPMEVKIKRMESNETSSSNSYSNQFWSSYDILKSNYSGVPGEQELQQEIGISLEDAKQQADEIVQSLGISNMALSGWEYQIKWNSVDDSNYSRENQLAAGYMLHYTRKIDGVPVTYNESYGGGLESIDSETETWCYERLDIILSSRGIEYVEFLDQYDIGAVQTENVQLSSFSDIIQTYEKMMQVQNADALNYENSVTYTIDRIELGYGRIYEPATDSRTGLLVPVWTFFGNRTSVYESDGQEVPNDGDNGPFYSTLCINAVDGSVIDQSLGY